MTLREIARLLDCTVISGHERLDTDVEVCFAADLMSDVLSFSRAGALMVTGLASIQSVHAADVADMKAILFVQYKWPGQSVIDAARQKGLPLLTTRRLMFETCGLLFASGLKAAGKEGPGVVARPS
jgi:predicted transcriptional regulator